MPEELPEFAKHADDPTHPAGNKELAEEMAHAGDGSRSDAAGSRQFAEKLRADGLDDLKLKRDVINGFGLAKSERVHAEFFDKEANKKEEHVRAEYIVAHPELTRNQEDAAEGGGEIPQPEQPTDLAVHSQYGGEAEQPDDGTDPYTGNLEGGSLRVGERPLTNPEPAQTQDLETPRPTHHGSFKNLADFEPTAGPGEPDGPTGEAQRILVTDESEDPRVQDPEKARAMALAGYEERSKAAEARERNDQYETNGWGRSTIGEATAEDADHTARHLEREAGERYDERNGQGSEAETDESEAAVGTSFMDRFTEQEPGTSHEPQGPTPDIQDHSAEVNETELLKQRAETALEELDQIMDKERATISPLGLKALDQGRKYLESLTELT